MLSNNLWNDSSTSSLSKIIHSDVNHVFCNACQHKNRETSRTGFRTTATSLKTRLTGFLNQRVRFSNPPNGVTFTVTSLKTRSMGF